MYVWTVPNLMRVSLYYISCVPYRYRPTNVEKSVAWVQCLMYRCGHTDHATQSTLSVITEVFNRQLKCAMHLSESALRPICTCLEVALQHWVRFLTVKFELWPTVSWSNVAYICPDLTTLSSIFSSSFCGSVCSCFWWKLVELHSSFCNTRRFYGCCTIFGMHSGHVNWVQTQTMCNNKSYKLLIKWIVQVLFNTFPSGNTRTLVFFSALA